MYYSLLMHTYHLITSVVWILSHDSNCNSFWCEITNSHYHSIITLVVTHQQSFLEHKNKGCYRTSTNSFFRRQKNLMMCDRNTFCRTSKNFSDTQKKNPCCHVSTKFANVKQQPLFWCVNKICCHAPKSQQILVLSYKYHTTHHFHVYTSQLQIFLRSPKN